MAVSPIFNPHRPVRCPSCRSESLQLLAEADRPDRVTQMPSDGVRSPFIANMQLYRCRACARQFYDIGPTAKPPVESTAAASTIIGQTVTIKGRLFSEENILLDGKIEGPLDMPAHRLTIAPSGRMRGDVRVAEVIALGTVDGRVNARQKLALRAGAHMTGSIRTPSLTIEEGAYFVGAVVTE